MVKLVLNYALCSALLFVAVVLLCSGGFWSLTGLLWCGLLVISGDVFRPLWRRFWWSNMRILKYFNCL